MCKERTLVQDRRWWKTRVGDILEMLGAVYYNRGDWAKAVECLEKALTIRIETGDTIEQAKDCVYIWNVFQSTDEYVKAEVYFETALEISIENCDRQGEATCYEKLGFCSGITGRTFQDYERTFDFEEALAIRIEVGDREREARCSGHLGTAFFRPCQLVEGKECLEKAISILQEIGDRKEEALRKPVLKSALVNMSRLKNILRKCFWSEEKLAIEKTRQTITGG